VDGADFLLWQRQVGLVAPAQAPAAQVPEPAALALSLMLSGIGIAARNPWAGRRPSSV
jgi:hypothetical protein